jgi:hypothetical protein
MLPEGRQGGGTSLNEYQIPKTIKIYLWLTFYFHTVFYVVTGRFYNEKQSKYIRVKNCICACQLLEFVTFQTFDIAY